jgi:hypothetical protein
MPGAGRGGLPNQFVIHTLERQQGYRSDFGERITTD